MFKKNDGITLIALMVMLLIMIIIFSITIVSANDILRNTQLNRLRVNLRLIKTQAATMFEDYMFDGTDNLGEKSTSAEINSVGWQVNDSNEIEYRTWDMDKVNSLGIELKKSSESEKFIIQLNKTTNEVDVASVKGYSDGKGNNYYSLSSLNNYGVE